MTQEEKAKAYDEAIKRAKQLYVDGMPQISRNTTEYIFPELKESEDERIRKALIRFHKSTIDVDGIKGKDIIAWLERQGEQKKSYMMDKKKSPYSEKRDFGYFEKKPADSYCQENCKGFQETGKCFADGDCKAKREVEFIDIC